MRDRLLGSYPCSRREPKAVFDVKSSGGRGYNAVMKRGIESVAGFPGREAARGLLPRAAALAPKRGTLSVMLPSKSTTGPVLSSLIN
jgi:hypothetical protein